LVARAGVTTLKRGEIWTVAGGSDYSTKPRPIVILQANRFDATDSITVCGLTTTDIDAPLFRILIKPTSVNNLAAESFVMVDKINTVWRRKLGYKIGKLMNAEMAAIGKAAAVFLGLANETSDQS
jgi:mRNA interferase MazF